jgi:UDP-N-acetylmuramate--alanine ligase
VASVDAALGTTAWGTTALSTTALSTVGPLPHHVHLVGIGGAGLSAVARVLAMRGHRVTGSDLTASPITRALNDLGVVTHVGHAAEYVGGAELVVASSAIPEGNPELVAARAAGIPVVRRQQLMPRLLAGRVGVAVAGTHGKTTTAAMLAVILERLGLSPSFVVGGVIADLGTNAGAGAGPHFVIEADEYDGMFLGLDPQVAVVTNVEMDHPDCYPDLDAVRQAFGRFLERVVPDGTIIACGDSAELARLLAERGPGGAHVVTYGLGASNDYRVHSVQPTVEGGIRFGVARGDEAWGAFRLSVPGVHNALNATAALLVAERLGVGRHEAGEVLSGFRGALRRFQVKGERGGITIIDDYAHHPTEIRATLAAARGRYDGRRIWAVWEPHTFSRVEALLGEFGACFGDADRVIVTDVYAARSRERATIQPETIVASIKHPNAHYVGGMEQVVAYLLERLERGDVLLTLGAGDGYRIGEGVLARLAREGM